MRQRALLGANTQPEMSKVGNLFIVGLYLQYCMEFDDKVSYLCEILGKIYNERNDAKIIMGGDFNVKSQDNEGKDLESLEDILEEYNISIKSDRKRKRIPT